MLLHCCKTIHVLESQKIWYFVISLPSHSNAHDEGVTSKNYSQVVAEICWGIPKTRGTHRKKVKCCVCTRWQNGEERKKISTRVHWGHSDYTSTWNCVTLANDVTLRYFTLLFVVVVFSFMRALLADLHHRTKIIFEKLTNWLIRINSSLLLKSEQNKTSCICFHNEKILETVDIETTKQQANTWMGTFNHSQKLIRGWNV